jgi:hypothetical protein
MSPSCRIISSVGRTNSIVRDDEGLVVGAEKFGPKTQAGGAGAGCTARHDNNRGWRCGISGGTDGDP